MAETTRELPLPVSARDDPGGSVEPWDWLAASYRRQEPLERRGLALLVRGVGLAPDQVVLDVGSGTGMVQRALPPELARGLRLLAVEPSAGMLAARPTQAAPAVRALAQALPVADRAVDVCLASWVLHLLGPAERCHALAELARATRPGGRLGVVVPAVPRDPVQRWLRGRAESATRQLGAFVVPHGLGDELAAAGFTVALRRRRELGYLAEVVVAVRRPA